MGSKLVENQCRAITKSGKPCRAAATEGGLCFFHANPNKASELGQIGGRKNRHQPPVDSTDPLPRLENAGDLRDLVGRLIVEVYAGKLHPRVATGLAPLINLQLRTIEATDLDRRLEKVEKRLAGGESHDIDPPEVTSASKPNNSHTATGMAHEGISLQETAD
jgi:Family of unknown function (DUF5763)